jgi:hypothetical protein
VLDAVECRPFNSAGGTVKTRLLLATVAIGAIGVAAPLPATPQVQAQTADCDERVPIQAFVEGALESRAEGSMAGVSLLSAPPAVAAGGAAVAGVGVSATTAAGSAVAAFFAASILTCDALETTIGGHSIGGFLDALVANAMHIEDMQPPTAPVPSTGITVVNDDCVPSDAGMDVGGLMFGAEPTANGCRLVNMPGFATGRTLRTGEGNTGRYVVANNAERTVGGVVIPELAGTGQYPSTYERSYVAMCYRQWSLCDGPTGLDYYPAPWNPRTLTTATFNYGGWNASNTYPQRFYGAMMIASEKLMLRCSPEGNIGGVCGTPPGRLFAVVDGVAPAFEAFFQPYEKARTHGWERRWVVNIRCHANTTAAYKLVESATYWDATVDVRVPVPACNAGQLLTGYTISSVPSGIVCTNTLLGCDTLWQTQRWTSPTSWTATATKPAYTTCLTTGNTCGSPAGTTSSCTMGGSSVVGDFCDSTLQVRAGDVSTVPELTVTVVPVLDAPVSTADPVTATDPGGGTGEPGTGVTVNIPIDEGQGECSGRAGCIAADADIGGGDEEECWLDGWGWFNPAEWVLRPVKCAMIWAFVPTDVEAWQDDQVEAITDVAPFSFMADGVEVLDELTEPGSASGDVCFGSMAKPGGGSTPLCIDLEVAAEHTQNGNTQKIAFFSVVGLSVLLFAFATLSMLK